MRKIAGIAFAYILAVSLLNVINVQATEFEVYDKAAITDGLIGVHYDVQQDLKTKLLVQSGTQQYAYDLFGIDEYEYFPLQMGNGIYKISVMENISGQKYKSVYSETIDVFINQEQSIYLNSIQNVKWSDNSQAIQKANQLCANSSDEQSKFTLIYNYVVTNVKYDYSKVKTLTTTYVPNIDNTFMTDSGICYDYASLMASMLRSQGIPTKLVKGYTDNVKEYHAWNEVYLNGQWVIVDTTYDSVMKGYNVKTTIAKSTEAYRPSKIY